MKTSDTALKIVKQFEKIAPGIYKDSELTPDGKSRVKHEGCVKAFRLVRIQGGNHFHNQLSQNCIPLEDV